MEVFTIKFSLNLNFSRDHTQLQIHGLFYLNLLHTNTPVCDFEILLKVLDHQQQLILYVATYLHQFLYLNIFFLVDAYWVRRLQNLTNLIGVTHKTFETWITVFLLHLTVLDLNPKCFAGFQAWFKIYRNRSSIVQTFLLIGRALQFLNSSFYNLTVLEFWLELTREI